MPTASAMSGSAWPTESASGGMPVHPHSAPVQQERASRTLTNRAINRAADRGWKRDQHDLAALATHPQDPMAVLLAHVVDVRARRLEDPEPQQPEQAYEREVERAVGPSRR